jgi:hydrogenase maturation factor
VALRIVELDATSELAVGENLQGARSTVEIAFVQGTSVGDTLLVHAGVALAKLPDRAEHGT